MSKYLVLTRVMLKNGSDSRNIKSNSKIKKLILFIVVMLAFLPTVKLFADFVSGAYDYLYKIGRQELILSVGISFASVFIFFFAIAFSLNVLYFSKDIDIFLPLPLRPWEILASKITLVIIYEYITEAFILLPVFFVYGYKDGAGVLYFIYSILIFLVVPIIPVVIASILNMIIMSFTNIGSHKDKLKILGGIFGMAFAVGLNIVIQKMNINNGDYRNMLKTISEGNNSIMSFSGRLFPHTDIAVNALAYSNNLKGFMDLVLFVILNAAVVVLFLLIGEKLYFKGAVGGSEISSKNREIDYAKMDRKVLKKSAFKTLLSQEMKILFRTPVYFMNCIVSNFILPIIFIIPFLIQPNSFHKSFGEMNISINANTALLFSVISIAAGMILGAINSITSTAISREGKNIFIKKYIPVSYKTQIMAKVFSGVLVGSLTTIIILIVSKIFINISVYFLCIAFVVSILGILFTAFTGILIDLNFPKLNWDNEVKAVKQNFNSFINVIIGLVTAGLFSFPIMAFRQSISVIAIFELAVIIILDYILYKITVEKGALIFENIE